jgi:ribosomal protein L15
MQKKNAFTLKPPRGKLPKRKMSRPTITNWDTLFSQRKLRTLFKNRVEYNFSHLNKKKLFYNPSKWNNFCPV